MAGDEEQKRSITPLMGSGVATSHTKPGKALKGDKQLLLSSLYSVIYHHTPTTDWTLVEKLKELV